MGILDISHGLYENDENLYKPLYEKYDYEGVNENYKNSGVFKNVSKDKSFYQITDFGKAFIIACNDLKK